jgi:hypothetical protein
VVSKLSVGDFVEVVEKDLREGYVLDLTNPKGDNLVRVRIFSMDENQSLCFRLMFLITLKGQFP